MRRAFVGFLLVGVAACSDAKPSSEADLGGPSLERGRDAFDIAVPADCKVTTKGMQIDFEVHYVECQGVIYAGVYVGNFADVEIPRSRLMKTPYGWPAEIQTWSNEVTGDQEKADAIAASVRVRKLP